MSTGTATATDAAVIADIVSRHIKPELLNLTGPEEDSEDVPLLVLPTSLQAIDVQKFLEPHRTAPKRREGTATLVELDSLIAHVNRFKDDDSALFAMPDEKAPTLTAVLDYNRRNLEIPIDSTAGKDSPTRLVPGSPRFGKHRAIYAFPLSDEWKAWVEQNGEAMIQAEFAAFLEDRITDVADPGAAFSSAKQFAETLGITSFASPSRLLELSRGLTVHVDDRTTNKVNTSTGELVMNFESEHSGDDGAPISVPRAFLIQLPVFRAGVGYQLPVRLKYRAASGRLTWSYEIHNIRKAFDDAFEGACVDASRGTSLPLFFGAPES